MRVLQVSVIASMAALTLGAPARAQVPADRVLQLSFDADGRVDLTARHVAVRDILAEWARQCGCAIVNANRLPGEPVVVPLQFEHEPQGRVLQALLGDVAGYVLTPRNQGTTGPSEYDTIYILATSDAVSGGYAPAPATPVATVPIATPGAPDDEIPPVQPIAVLPPRSNRPSEPPTPQAPPASLPGTPGTFVPIIPIGPGGTPQTTAPQPGTVVPIQAPAPGTVAPSTTSGGR